MSTFFDIDTYIVLGLVGIAVLLFLISRMGLLPKKSLPYIAAALAGAFGLALFNKLRSDNLNEEIKQLEEDLKKREKKLEEIKITYEASDRKLEEKKAELDDHLAAYKKETLLIKEENKKEKERIEKLSGEELHNEFRKAFGNP